MNDWNLFYHICRLGIFFQFTFGMLGDPTGFLTLGRNVRDAVLTDPFSQEKLRVCAMVLVNGICYYTYLQFSWVVLMKVKVVTHAVGNSMRRPVVLVCSVIYFKNEITLINAAGILCAFVGVVFYTSINYLLPRKPAVAPES